MLSERGSLSDISPGDKFQALVVALRMVRGCTDKNGRPYADLKIADWSGWRSAKIWKVTEAEISAIAKAEFLEISGHVEASDQYSGQFTIIRYDIVPVPDDITPFLEVPPPSSREYRERFGKLIKSVADPELKSVLRGVFGDDGFRSKFYRAFAASGVHHAFPGGLLEHTVEVAELCSGVCTVISGLDRDLLVAGALLHDIGKMREMNQELRAGEYTDDGCLIGHIVLGTIMVTQAVTRFNDGAAPEARVSDSSLRALLHLILSHHGLMEHGAAKKPAFAEASVLYLCDNISAKSRQFKDLAAKNTVGATSGWDRFLETQVYLKPVRTIPESSNSSEDALDFMDSELMSETGCAPQIVLPILDLVGVESGDQTGRQETRECRSVVPPPDGADYLLRVSGDGIADAGIRSGDLLFVREQDTAEDGDIVIAELTGDGQALKRLRVSTIPEHGIPGAYLEAGNCGEACESIPLGADGRIQGKVTGLLRDF